MVNTVAHLLGLLVDVSSGNCKAAGLCLIVTLLFRSSIGTKSGGEVDWTGVVNRPPPVSCIGVGPGGEVILVQDEATLSLV